MLPQNKISGTNIAWARGSWGELEDGTMGFDFPERDAFKITVNPETLESMGVEEKDLLDCIIQIEKDLGSPKDHRLALGLYPKQGFSKNGIVVTSRSNDKVICSFTPTNLEDKRYDGYFEWYFNNLVGDKIDNMSKFMVDYDQFSATRSTRLSLSPAMPSYGEACEISEQVEMEPAARSQLLEAVWAFHKTTSRGFKRKLEEEFVPVWRGVLTEMDEKSEMQEFTAMAKKASVSSLNQIIDDLMDLDRHYKDNRPEEIPAVLNQKKVQAKLKVAQDVLYSRSNSMSLDLPII